MRNAPSATRTQIWQDLNELTKRQANNPNNMIIRRSKNPFKRNSLVVEVVDANPDTASKNKVFSQGIMSNITDKKGLKVFSAAENEANRLNDANQQLGNIPLARDFHFYPGGKLPEKIIKKQKIKNEKQQIELGIQETIRANGANQT